jgi:membrane fusion protein (multidrug efflux system)
MRKVSWLLVAVLLGMAGGYGLRSPSVSEPPQAVAGEKQAPGPGLEVAGRTQPAPGRSARIAPAVLHPVEEVLVKVGDKVKKDQVLVRIDADEPKADLRSKEASWKEMQASLERFKKEPREEEKDEAKASLESAEVSTKQAQEYFERIKPVWEVGGLPAKRYHDARAALLKAEADERATRARLKKLEKRPVVLEIAEMEARIAAAKANMESAKFELEHYEVTAPIEGVITSLDVVPGMVSRPGTSEWGEIIDIRELDVRCEVPPAQLDGIALKQNVEVIQDGRQNAKWKGQVVAIGHAANPATGRIPVLIRVPNPDERLLCYVTVRVRFGNGNR